jgi:NADP-dependent 3-hydroxy acid dehydrogenase YdfG
VVTAAGGFCKRFAVQIFRTQPELIRTGLHDRWEVYPSELLGIAEPLTPADIARKVLFILKWPAHIRITQLVILANGHEI